MVIHCSFIAKSNTKKFSVVNFFNGSVSKLNVFNSFLEVHIGSKIINWHLPSFSNKPLFLNHLSNILISVINDYVSYS